MATRVLEFSGLPGSFDNVPLAPMNELLVKNPPITPGASPSSPITLNANTHLVCIQGDEDVSVDIGASPLPDSSCLRVYAKVDFWAIVKPGDKVSVKL